MSSLDHSPGTIGTIYRVIGDTALDATTLKRIGGVAGTTYVPAGMTVLLGIYAHLFPTTITDDEANVAWGYLDTEDGFNLKPFEFLFPAQGCCGGDTAATNSMPGIFYPINCPVVPGGRINAYGQAYEDATVEPYVAVTYLVGRNIVLPRMLDDHPGRQRWRKVGHNLTGTLGTAWAPENQYQFTLSAIGGAVTEIGGVLWTSTQDPVGNAGGCTLQLRSSDIPVFPMEINLNAYGAVLGTAFAHDGSDTVTRRACSAFGERVVHIDAQLVMNGGSDVATGFFVSMVEFVRRGE